jgi:hypothetical protein
VARLPIITSRGKLIPLFGPEGLTANWVRSNVGDQGSFGRDSSCGWARSQQLWPECRAQIAADGTVLVIRPETAMIGERLMGVQPRDLKSECHRFMAKPYSAGVHTTGNSLTIRNLRGELVPFLLLERHQGELYSPKY